MASRRIRIKGIANIPQRKKTNLENTACNIDTPNSNNILSGNECKALKNEESESADKFIGLPDSSSVNYSKLIKDLSSVTQNDVKGTIEEVNNKNANFSNILECSKSEVIASSNDCNLKVTEMGNNSLVTKSTTLCAGNSTESIKDLTNVFQMKEIENQNPQTNMLRRKFLKPGINLNAVRKRPTSKDIIAKIPTTDNTDSSQDVEQDILDKNVETKINLKPSEKVVVISEIRIPKQEYKSVPGIWDKIKTVSKERNSDGLGQGSEVTLNETNLCANESHNICGSVVTFSHNIKKIIPEIQNVSDSEYPAPPPSPSKMNRSRIKAIPRLSQRKTSCSASESEDETRKYGRIRNNSVCSIVSTSCLEPPTPISETIPPKDPPPHVPKKLFRSEQSRKVAEARREFHKRFGSKSPDRQKLKMIDLIFYNPTTNPMSQKNIKISDNKNMKIEKESEENVDDPPEANVNEKKAENGISNSMPVPQIKIGPSGEIILDEQSLIVENSEVARQKEQMRNSEVVNGDFDTGYGIYKRAARSLAWSQKETIRFYQALNLIGTDFTVMGELFRNRTRRELKIKFKKEERTNKQLIDKAIMQPCNYNFADLKRKIEIEEEEEVALQKLKEEEMEKAKKVQLDRITKHEKKRKEQSTEEIKNVSQVVNYQNNDTISLPPKKRIKCLSKLLKVKSQLKETKPKSLTINSVLDDSDADISDEEETIPFLKPTRSGRMPKSTARNTTIVEQTPKKYFYDSKKVTNSNEATTKQWPSTITFATPDEPSRKQPASAIRNRRSSSLSSIESNSDKLVPGSVVIMLEEDANGQSGYKVFMVTPEKKMAPLDLSSDIIAKLIQERQNDENSPEFLVPPVLEENITIPASYELRNVNDNAEFVIPEVLEENVTVPVTDELQNNDKAKFLVRTVPVENITIHATDERQNDNTEFVILKGLEENLTISVTDECQNDNKAKFLVSTVPLKNITIPDTDERQNDNDDNAGFVTPKVVEENVRIHVTDEWRNDDKTKSLVPTVPAEHSTIPTIDERHIDGENIEFLIVNDPVENFIVPATDKNVVSKKPEPEKIIFIKCPGNVTK